MPARAVRGGCWPAFALCFLAFAAGASGQTFRVHPPEVFYATTSVRIGSFSADETKVLLEKLGIAPGKVTVSGIPIDPVFAAEKDRRGMRRKHGLDEEKTTILVSAGGFGVGPMERLVRSLLELERRGRPT